MFKTYLLITFTLLIFSAKSYSQGIFQRGLDISGVGNDIIESADHNFICTGEHLKRVFISKIDSAGDTIWVKYFGTTVGILPTNEGNSITYINDNRYLVTGYSGINEAQYEYNLYGIMIDSAGNEIWENTYGNNDNFIGANAVYDTINQRIYFIGSAYEVTKTYLVKTDTSGNLIWSNYYTFGNSSYGQRIFMRTDTDIFIAGGMDTNNTHVGMLLEVDSSGTVISMKHFGINPYNDFQDFRILPDSGFMILGTTQAQYPYSKIWLLRLDKNGDTILSKEFGQDSTDLEAYHFAYSSSNKYWICANDVYDNFHFFIYETDTSGNVLFELIPPINSSKLLYSIIESSDHSIYAIGYSDSISNFGDDVFLVRLDSDYLYNGIKENILSEKFAVYPNPTKDVVYMKTPENINFDELQIFIIDVLGKKYSITYSIVKNNLICIQLPFDNGLYILSLHVKKQIIQNKLIIQK